MKRTQKLKRHHLLRAPFGHVAAFHFDPDTNEAGDCLIAVQNSAQFGVMKGQIYHVVSGMVTMQSLDTIRIPKLQNNVPVVELLQDEVSDTVESSPEISHPNILVNRFQLLLFSLISYVESSGHLLLLI
ncbi:MAG: hypothetical protein AAF974_09735 [Cyanobacteria bacterium P01_E01_bin.34]